MGDDFFIFVYIMIGKFLEYIAVEKRYSEHTITSYKKDLEDFLSFVKESEGTENLIKVHKKVVRNFMIKLSEDGISKRTINRKLSSLRSFYLFLLRVGCIQVSPMETIQAIKFYPEKQIPFSVEEMEDLQNSEIYQDESYILERLIIELLYQTGMRKAELCNLRYSNVDLSKKELKIIGKGNKMRIVPILDNLIDLMNRYLIVRKPLKEYEEYFLINKKGKKVNEKKVYLLVNEYLSFVTSKEKKSPHILRHSFATHILGNGAEISKVKALLGHSSLVSTQVYTDANIVQLKKVFNKTHPRAKE